MDEFQTKEVGGKKVKSVRVGIRWTYFINFLILRKEMIYPSYREIRKNEKCKIKNWHMKREK